MDNIVQFVEDIHTLKNDMLSKAMEFQVNYRSDVARQDFTEAMTVLNERIDSLFLLFVDSEGGLQ